MKYLKIAAFLGIIVFFASCDDFFDQTTTIEIPPHQPKLGVTALWLDQDADFLVTVFASVGALEDEQSSAISNAEITLTENGNQLLTFVENSSKKGLYLPASQVTLTPGKSYELTVSAPNFETVKATQIMPNNPTIKSAKYTNSNSKLHVSISDDEGTDYYVIGFQTKHSPTHYSDGYVYSEGGIAEDSGLNYHQIILKDETFAGKDINLVQEAYSSISSTQDSVIVNLYSVTSDYYRFDRTYYTAQDANENPFAEPVILHRNFEKGFGVFALGTKASLIIPIE